MALRHFSAYSTDLFSSGIGGTVASASFTTDFTVEGKFFTGFSASVDFNSYSDSLVSIKNAINAIITPEIVDIRYDWDLGKIILSSSTPLYFSFNDAAQKVLGFNSIYGGGTTIITGTFKPYFIWSSTNDQRTDDTEIYEDKQVYFDHIADSGRSYSIGSDKTTMFRDWSFSNEPKENLYFNKANSSSPFTYDLFLKWNRKGPYPFVIFDDTIATSLNYDDRDGTYEMRAQATIFKPKQLFQDYYDYWNIDLKTRLLSRPNQNQTNNFTNLSTTGSYYGKEMPSGLILRLKSDEGGISIGRTDYLSKIYDQSGLENYSDTNTTSYIRSHIFSLAKPSASYYQQDRTPTLPESLISTGSLADSNFSGVTMMIFLNNQRNYSTLTSYSYYIPTFEICNPSKDTRFFLGYQKNSAKHCWFTGNTSSNEYNILTNSINLLANNYYIFIGKIDFTTLESKFYINGTNSYVGQYTTGSNPSATTYNITQAFQWALSDINQSTNVTKASYIDEILVFNRSLSNTELNYLIQNYSGPYSNFYEKTLIT